jgi:hypothetical protein
VDDNDINGKITVLTTAQNITICNPAGKKAVIDFSGDEVTYSGDLPIADAAKVFFMHVGHFVRGGS